MCISGDVIASAESSLPEDSAEAVTELFAAHLVFSQFAFKLGYFFHEDTVTCVHPFFFGLLGLFFLVSQRFLNSF